MTYKDVGIPAILFGILFALMINYAIKVDKMQNEQFEMMKDIRATSLETSDGIWCMYYYQTEGKEALDCS